MEVINMTKSHWTLGELAKTLGGTVHGDPAIRIHGICSPDEPEPGCLVVIWSSGKQVRLSSDIPAVGEATLFKKTSLGIEVDNAREALIKLLDILFPTERPTPGIHPTALIGEETRINPSAFLGPHVVVGSGSNMGEGVVIEANVCIGHNVQIAENTVVESGVVLRDRTEVGKNCVIHSGAVLGCDGFGFIPDMEHGHKKIPQVGRVVIGNNVEIGACVTIDRATIGSTVVGSGTVIDDHVHIGHNAKIGKNCILIAMTGIAGSAVLEDGVIMAARSGVADHVTIGKGAQVAAYGGATKDVSAGKVVSGFPARDHMEEMKKQVSVAKLPALIKELRELKKKVASLLEKPESGI